MMGSNGELWAELHLWRHCEQVGGPVGVANTRVELGDKYDPAVARYEAARYALECEPAPAAISTQDLAVYQAEARRQWRIADDQAKRMEAGGAGRTYQSVLKRRAYWEAVIATFQQELRGRIETAAATLGREDLVTTDPRPEKHMDEDAAREHAEEKVAAAEEASREIPFTVALDFDGVMAQYDGWKGEDVLGERLDALHGFLVCCQAREWNVITHSTRNGARLKRWALHEGLDQYIAGYNVNPNAPEGAARGGKPIAHVYVDDRGERFPKNGGEDPRAAFVALFKRLKEIEQEERT